MAIIFYILLVSFTYLKWSWGWFILSIIFSLPEGSKIITKYKYTNEKDLDGIEEEE